MDFDTVFQSIGKPDWADLLRGYLEEGKDINRRHPVSGWTLLHEAVELCQYEAIAMLIEYGASPNIQDEYGMSPLSLMVDVETQGKVQAGMRINYEAVEKLLDAGADPTIPNKAGRTPIDLSQIMDKDLELLLSSRSRRFKDLEEEAK